MIPPNQPTDPDILARLAAAEAMIQREFHRGLQLSEVARASQYSSFHFHRLFHRHYGKTPKQLMSELQVGEIQRLLLAGVPLAEAAKRVGFAHQSHMTMRFKQLVGQTPKQWLRAQRSSAGRRRVPGYPTSAAGNISSVGRTSPDRRSISPSVPSGPIELL